MLFHMFGPYNNQLNATASAGYDWGFGMMHGYPSGGMIGNYGVFGWIAVLFWTITWILFIIAMIVLIRWLWKKGDK